MADAAEAEEQAGTEDDIQWHPGFRGGMYLVLWDYLSELIISKELPLGNLPPMTDVVIVKKSPDTVIDLDICRGYRKHNVIEYKGPGDELTVKTLCKAIGYAGFYVYVTPDCALNEITISVYRHAYPRAMFKELKEEELGIEREAPGVYRIIGLVYFPLRVVVMRELDAKQYTALRLLTKSANDAEALRFIQETSREKRGDFYQQNVKAVLNVSTAANRKLYRRIWKEIYMNRTLRELMKDEMKAELEVAQQKSWQDGRKEGREEGKIRILSQLINTGLLNEKKAAGLAGMTEKQFREAAARIEEAET